MTTHQRKNSSSNTAVGNDFEELTLRHFRKLYPDLVRPFWLPIGHIEHKNHRFDIGSREAKVIVECKSHTWTEGGNTPSAKHLHVIPDEVEFWEIDEDIDRCIKNPFDLTSRFTGEAMK